VLTTDGDCCNFDGRGNRIIGNGTSRLFVIGESARGCSFTNLTLEEGTTEVPGVDNRTWTCDQKTKTVAEIEKYGGGAILNLGEIDTIEGVTFRNNDAGCWGGGIYSAGGNLAMVECHFEGNHAEWWGGGIYSANGSLTIESTNTFTANSAEYGGAIVMDQSQLDIQDGTFTENIAYSRGGAVYMIATQRASFFRSAFYGNRAFDGGAVAAYFEAEKALLLPLQPRAENVQAGRHLLDAHNGTDQGLSFVDVDFDGNSATNSGGALLTAGVKTHDLSMFLETSQFRSNTAGCYGIVNSFQLPHYSFKFNIVYSLQLQHCSFNFDIVYSLQL
jgi:predicted outer membrane repeat protein